MGTSSKHPGASLAYGKPYVRSDIAEGEERLPFLLSLPSLAVDYNRGMNGADIYSQMWSCYTTANQLRRCNWWPILWALLDAMVCNTAKICQRLGSKLTHRQIQLHLAYHFLRNPANHLRQRACTVSIDVGGATKIPRQEGYHGWAKTTTWGVKKRNCQGCANLRGRPRKALGERTGNNKVRCHSGCLQCKAALCSSYC